MSILVNFKDIRGILVILKVLRIFGHFLEFRNILIIF
jgi:hypothetical protein